MIRDSPVDVVDLTFPIHEGMTTFPVHWHPFVEVSQLGRLGMEGRETRKVVLGTHTGTHCDAPLHFLPSGRSIDQVPLKDLIGPATVLDLTDLEGVVVNRDALESRLAPGLRPRRILLRYGWSSRWGTREYYRGHPYLTLDAARWLVDLGVVLVGMDTPMPDDPRNGYGSDNDSPVHKILLGADVTLAEYLCNLDLIPAEVFVAVLPLAIAGADGAPARVVAWARDT